MGKGRKIVAVLITAVMLLSMMPAGVFAENVVLSDTAEEQKLFFRHVEWNDDDLLEEDLTRELSTRLALTINRSVMGFFYYGTETTAERVAFEQLEVTGEAIGLEVVSVERLANSDEYGYVTLVDALAFGTGTITYQDSALSIEVLLPNIGVYTTTTATEESYLEQTLTLGAEWPMYFCIRPDMAEAGYRFDSVSDAPSWVSTTVAEDGTYVAVELTEDAAGENWCNIHFDLISNAGNIGTWGESFEVKDVRPGLKWAYVRYDDNDVPYADMNDIRNDLDYKINRSVRAAFYFVDGESMELLSPDELVFPDFVTLESVEEGYPEFVRVRFKDFGEGEVTYTRDGVTYSMSASSSLPDCSYYSAPERTEENYIGSELVFDGKDDTGTHVGEETFYLMLQDGWQITELELRTDDMGFYTWEIPEGESYAVVTITEGFNDEYYEVLVYGARTDDPDNTGEWWADFEVVDKRPGLKWAYVRYDDNDVPYADMNDIRNDLDYKINSSVRAAFYFVDGESMELLSPDELVFPDFVTLESVEEGYPEFVRVRFKNFGEGEVTYTRDGVTYTMSASVGLPSCSYYSAPERTEENYIGSELVFDGYDENGEAVNYETFYLMLQDNWKVTELELRTDNMDFYTWEIPEGENYAVVTISEGFSDEYYEVLVYGARTDDPDNTSDWWADFEVVDKRPGLKWAYVRYDDNDVPYADMEDIRSDLNYSINNNIRAVFYFVDGEIMELLSPDELVFPDFITLETLDDSTPEFVRVRFKNFGEGEVTYTRDGVTYTMPASAGLPSCSYYSAPERTEENYIGSELVFDGYDENGEAVNYETFYLMLQDNWKVTDIELYTNGMDFYTWEIPEGENYAVVTISEGFSDEYYEVLVYGARTDDPDNTNDWWADFRMVDDRPGLRWCWLQWDSSEPVPETDELYSSINGDLGDTWNIAVYLTTQDGMKLIPVSQLTFPETVAAEPLEENADYMYLEFLTCTSDSYVTYTEDGVTYRLPITIQLPAAGFYSETTPSEEAHLSDGLYGLPGEIATAYFVWDPDQFGAVSHVEVLLNENGTTVVQRVDIAQADLSPWGITLTPNWAENYVRIDVEVSTDLWMNLRLVHSYGSYSNSIGIGRIYDHWESEAGAVITYDGVPYTFAIGEIYDDVLNLYTGGRFGQSGDGMFSREVVVGAMAWHDTTQETEAPAEVMNAIQNVEFRINQFVNIGTTGDQAVSNVAISDTYTCDLNGKSLAAAQLTAEAGNYFYAELIANFTVALPGMEPVECTATAVAIYTPDDQLSVSMESLDTADELNAAFASRTALMSWLEQEQPDVYEEYQQMYQMLGYAPSLSFILPAVTYQDVICYGVEQLDATIVGSEDEATGARTIMPGFRYTADSGRANLNNIRFVADKNITMTWNGETFTCGVLCAEGEGYSTFNCTFEGFDYGIRCTENGYIVTRTSVFLNCGVGYLVDCGGKDGGNANSNVTGNRFVGCDVAVRIVALPEYISPYEFRIYNNDFLDNGIDMDVVQKGSFYFYRNYFGTRDAGVDIPESQADASYRHARIRTNGVAQILTNPRWNRLYWGGSSNELVIDCAPGLAPYLINGEAADFMLPNTQLNNMLNEANNDVHIYLTDAEGSTMAFWTFEQKNVGEQTLSGRFNPALTFGTDENGNLTVSVAESSILALRVPVLTIPTGYLDAVVTFDGASLEGVVVHAGQVSFPVAAGGTYTIAEKVLAEEAFVSNGQNNGDETIPEDTVAVSWYDYGYQDGGEPESSFVQMGVKEEVYLPEADEGEADNVTEAEIKEVVEVEAIYQAPEDADVTVLLVLYDANGQMLAMQWQEAQQNEGTKIITVQCNKDLITTGAVIVKAFIVDVNGTMTPLAPVPFSQTLQLQAQ